MDIRQYYFVQSSQPKCEIDPTELNYISASAMFIFATLHQHEVIYSISFLSYWKHFKKKLGKVGLIVKEHPIY